MWVVIPARPNLSFTTWNTSRSDLSRLSSSAQLSHRGCSKMRVHIKDVGLQRQVLEIWWEHQILKLPCNILAQLKKYMCPSTTLVKDFTLIPMHISVFTFCSSRIFLKFLSKEAFFKRLYLWRRSIRRLRPWARLAKILEQTLLQPWKV